MSLYELMLWLHVTGALLWVGGGVMPVILAELARRSRDDVELAYLVGRIALLGPRFLAPLSGITGLLGILLVLAQDAFAFADVWVGVALALWLASSIMGGALLSPRATRVRAAIAQSGRITDADRGAVDQVLLLSRIDAVMLLVVVFLMAVKPGA